MTAHLRFRNNRIFLLTWRLLEPGMYCSLFYFLVLSRNITEQISDDDDDDDDDDVSESAILARIGLRAMCGCPDQNRPVCAWLLGGFVEFENPCDAMCSYVSSHSLSLSLYLCARVCTCMSVRVLP